MYITKQEQVFHVYYTFCMNEIKFKAVFSKSVNFSRPKIPPSLKSCLVSLFCGQQLLVWIITEKKVIHLHLLHW